MEATIKLQPSDRFSIAGLNLETMPIEQLEELLRINSISATCLHNKDYWTAEDKQAITMFDWQANTIKQAIRIANGEEA